MTTLPRGRAYTRADLERLPDDGRRHEIVDGTLVVTPAPSARHQIVVVNLLVALKASCPSEFQVLTAPFDVALTADTIVQPDVLVARRSELTARELTGLPVLAVEVLSASTRRIDLTLKRAAYEAAGCPAYWAVDPQGARITAWQLERGVYAESGQATGEQSLAVTFPFRLSLTPARLLD